ncbi:MAG: hypothetical protein LBP60_02350 [Spirochaetaceae bacterium]|jgi:hypothetical protein|nr:hypothetical protein [Spirochaetaceae bacterium]
MNSPALRIAKPLAALLLQAALLVSCVTTDPFIPVDEFADQENFSQAVAVLEERHKSIYREKDIVLYYLDKGLLTHYAGNYEVSSALLEEGERAIEKNFAVSISQELGTILVSDRAREYDGEDYEDIYLNAFNALNYYRRGNMDEALVEIRRMNNKLRDLSVKYGTIMTGMQKLALENNTTLPPNPGAPLKFNNSALARYLGMLFYRGAGLPDDARIDQRQLQIAMADAPSVYPHPLPSSVMEELAIPPGLARLNVIGFAGRSPVKQEELIRIPLGMNWIKIALPVMSPRYSQVVSIKVIFDSGENFALELLEHIGAVVTATFEQKKNLIYTRSVLRASVKGVTAAVFDTMAENSSENSGLFTLLSLGTQMFAEASERADLRQARYFPDKAYVGGINLTPGTYSFSIIYYGGGGRVLAVRRHENVPLRENSLNLVEEVCLK